MKLIMENFRSYIKETGEDQLAGAPVPELFSIWDANAVEEWLGDKILMDEDELPDNVLETWQLSLKNNPEEWIEDVMKHNSINLKDLEDHEKNVLHFNIKNGIAKYLKATT